MQEIAKLGAVVKSWLDFWYAVSDTRNLLAESSIRFPITSFLERRKGVDNIQLECQHSIFPSRHIDLKWDTTDDKTSLMEIKFVRKDSAYANEMQRIFNDLVRLAVINKDNTDTYFMLCGYLPMFDDVFVERKTPEDNHVKERLNNEQKILHTILDNWLGFYDSSNINIIMDNNNYWQEFMKTYEYSEFPKGWGFITKQEFLQKQGLSIVGIWSIHKKNYE